MKAWLVKPVKHDLNSCSSVFTPVSSISKTEISGKILPDTGYYRIAEFYRILVSGSGTSLVTCRFSLLKFWSTCSFCFSFRDKAQVLPSYTLNMRNIDPRLSNVIDIQFLHGYYEPTLLILFEPLKTWPG